MAISIAPMHWPSTAKAALTPTEEEMKRSDKWSVPPCPTGTCAIPLQVMIGFDGTNNNMERDFPDRGHSNVVRLFRAFPAVDAPGDFIKVGHYRNYIPGVGTRSEENSEWRESADGKVKGKGILCNVVCLSMASASNLRSNSMQKIQNTSLFAFAVIWTFGVCISAGCSDHKPPESEEEKAFNARIDKRIAEAHARDVPTIAVAMTCSDHHPPSTPGNVGWFAVEEVWYGQITKRFVNGIGCGGDMHVGYPLPAKWQPHMKVLVRWVPPWSDDRKYTIERYTTIPYYAEAATLAVHFFSKERVRVVVSSIGPEGTHHPIPPGSTEPPAEVDGELEQPPNPPNPTPTPKHDD